MGGVPLFSFYRASGRNKFLAEARSFNLTGEGKGAGCVCSFYRASGRNQLSGEGRSFALNGEGK